MYILGVRIDEKDIECATEHALSLVGRGGSVFTPNSLMINRASEDECFRKILNSSDLNIPDGEGVVFAAKKLFGKRIKKTAGVDFGLSIAEKSVCGKYKIFIYGGALGVAETAKSKLEARIPNLNICGACDGYGGSFPLSKIAAAKPDIVFVCLGSPLQEKWIFENKECFPTVLFVALGGSVDVYSGKIRRAPHIIIRMKLEWLWRMILQPKRLKNLIPIVDFLRKILCTDTKKHLKKE